MPRFRPISMRVRLFSDESNHKDVARSRKAMLWMLESLARINEGWIRQTVPKGKPIPSLYDYDDIVYQRENNSEEWKDIPSIISDGFGDCEDLAAWRVAELRAAGINARPRLVWTDPPRPGGARFHAVVLWPNGRIEDPSLAKGMSGHPIVNKPVYIRER